MKKIVLFLVMLALLIMPVMGETINYDYTFNGEGLTTTTSCSSGGGPYPIDELNFDAISEAAGLKSVITGFSSYYPSTVETDDYADCAASFYISGNKVGDGTFGWNRQKTDAGTTIGFTSFFIMDTWNVAGYTGGQTVDIVLDNSDLMPTISHYGSTSFASSEGIGNVLYTLHGGCPAQKTKTYHSIDFHQELNYNDNDGSIDIDFSRFDSTNHIKIVNSADIVLYDISSNEDILRTYYENTVLQVSVYNPYAPTGDPWVNFIPETSTSIIPDEQTALIDTYVYDAVSRNLINGHNTTLYYDGSDLPNTCSWPGGVSHTTIDWGSYSSANLTFSAPGYEDSLPYHFVASSVDISGIWLEVGSNPQNYVYLNPVGTPSNVTAYVTFEVTEQISGDQYFYSSGAAVTVGDLTLITSGPGSCSFELAAGTYQYIVKKVGFQSVAGSVTVGTSNQYIGVKLPKIATAPTPTGVAGTDYPYADVDPYAQAETSMGIIFSSLPGWAGLAVLVVTISFVGWLKPKK